MIITQKIMEQGMSSRGGWSARQLRALGIETVRFNSGWRKRLIGSYIPDEKVALFLKLKDKHLKKDAEQAKMFV